MSVAPDGPEDYRFLVEQATDVISRHSMAGHYLYVSPAIQPLLGYQPEELLGRQLTELWHPDDRDSFAAHQPQNDVSPASRRITYRAQHKAGHWIWLETNLQDIVDATTGLPHAQVAVTREVSDRIVAEQMLRQRERDLSETQQLAHLGSWSFDLAANRIHWSPETFHIYGRDPQQAEPSYEELLRQTHPDDVALFQHNVEQAITVGQPYEHEIRIFRLDGSLCYTLGRGRVVRDDQGNVMRLLGTVLDITERKQAEITLRQQAERERLMAEITRHIRQTLNLDDILETTVAEVRRLLPCDRVLIYRFNEDWSGQVVAESVSNPELSIRGEVIYDPCFGSQWHRPYCQGRTSAVENIYQANLRPCYVELLSRLQVWAKLVVPILQQDQLWGLLIAHHSVPRAWQSWEIDLLKQLADQVAIALQQSALYQQVQQLNISLELQVQERTRQLQQMLDFEALLKRITDKVRDSLDESYILQTAVQELVTGLNLHSCDAGLYNLSTNTAEICYEHISVGVPKAQGTVLSMADYPEVYPGLLAGAYLQFCWLPWGSPIRPSPSPLLSLCCPLIDDQGAIGDLWLYRSTANPLGALEIRLVQQVANHCAIALRQARLYRAAQTQVEELERLNQLKDDFLSTVSHELRTPMSNIQMATQMLEGVLTEFHLLNLDQTPPNQTVRTELTNTDRLVRYFQMLKDECHREMNLINDLLDLTRLEAGTEPLLPLTLDLATWIPHLTEPFVERMHRHQQTLSFQLPPHLPLTTDFSYLERVLTELLQNACKYTPAGESISLSAQQVHERAMSCQSRHTPNAAASSSSYIEICVSNSGVGIPATERDRVFDKFYRIPNNDPWKYGGTGLGLALVKRLVESLNATIDVDSNESLTRFILKFPIFPTVDNGVRPKA